MREGEQIKREFVRFYTELFSPASSKVDVFEREFLSLLPVLDEETRKILEEPICLKDVETTIDELKRGKAPGPDGLGSDLYRMYKNKVAPFLFLVFEETFKNGALPKTFTRTHTILIPKSEDPLKRQSVTGYRPITLDYKIRLLPKDFRV